MINKHPLTRSERRIARAQFDAKEKKDISSRVWRSLKERDKAREKEDELRKYLQEQDTRSQYIEG